MGVYIYVTNILYKVLSCLKYDKIKFVLNNKIWILISLLLTNWTCLITFSARSNTAMRGNSGILGDQAFKRQTRPTRYEVLQRTYTKKFKM
jgi:hypothetical protein